jgi:hypothetical protein
VPRAGNASRGVHVLRGGERDADDRHHASPRASVLPRRSHSRFIGAYGLAAAPGL